MTVKLQEYEINYFEYNCVQRVAGWDQAPRLI